MSLSSTFVSRNHVTSACAQHSQKKSQHGTARIMMIRHEFRGRVALAIMDKQPTTTTYKTGPVDCHRVPTSAPPGRKDGFYLHHDVEDVCRSDRRAAGVGEESAQGARSCDLEGNRAGLGCLEHLRNALSFAVVTEWPVGV